MNSNPEKRMAFLAHLEELRNALYSTLLFYIAVTSLCTWFGSEIFAWLRTPLTQALPENSFFVASNAVSGWLIHIKIALVAGAVVTFPILFLRVLSFASPGLKSKEKWAFVFFGILVLSSFYLGIFFAYEFVLPLSLKFFVDVYSATDVRFLPNIEEYFSYATLLLFGFGVVFILPYIVLGLLAARIVSFEQISRARPYIYVATFIVAAILTPPDIASQLMMALPFLVLFEVGLLVARIFIRPVAQSTSKATD